MDLTVVELGLRNRQISTVQCFLKIQIETFRKFVSVFGDQCIQNKPQISAIERFFNDWEQVFSKLNIVISANITDTNSREFAICLARASLQSCNQLLIIVNEVKFDKNFSEMESKFYKLFVKTIRSIRLSLKIHTNDNKYELIDSNEFKILNWDENTSDVQIINDSLRSDRLVLGQYWLKKHRNLDKSWNQIIKNVILLSLYYLRINDFDNLNVILCQLGLPFTQLIHKIYIFTSNNELRQMLVNKYNAEIFSLQDSNIENITDILKFVDSSKDSNVSLTISWIIDMGNDLLQRGLILPLFRESRIILYNNLSPFITWNYLIDRNDSEMLMEWITKLSVNTDLNTFPFNWIIDQNMIESLDKRASVLTRESILNLLCTKGMFCLSESNDFQSTLYRIGRMNAIESNGCPNIFIDERLCFQFSSFKSNVFTDKLIEYCIDHNLNEFLYIFFKHSSAIEMCSIDHSLIDLLKASINCSQNPTNEQILANILLTAQYIYSMESPVTIKSLTFSDSMAYLALIASTYSYLNVFDICNEKSDDLLNNSDASKQSIANVFKTQYPILYHSLSECSKSDFQNELNYEQPTIYMLLKDSTPFDISKMFCWQSLNNFECNEDYITSMVFNELPHFSHTKLADLYGLKANMTFTYYLNQGRVVEAYNKFISNRKVLNSKSMELACRRAALVAYNDTTNNHIAVACIVFQQLLSGESKQTLLHLSVANIVMSFAADFLSLNVRQQQIELSNLLKRSHYYSDKRAAEKLLQLTVAAISRKYKNFRNIQIEECFDWKIAVKFAKLHKLDLPLDFLTKCAANDNWLIFTIFCQIHEYPKDSVFIALKKFNNECISDHLNKAFQSSQIIVSDNVNIELSSRILNKTEGLKNTSAKHLRNVLYSKIGLREPTELPDNSRNPRPSLRSTTSLVENDTISIASETDYNAVETISVISSSNMSEDEDMPKFNPENAPKDLFQIILNCQTDPSYDARKPLMYSSIPLSNPILCLIACSVNSEFENFKTFNTFSCWLLASVDFQIREQFCKKVSDFDPLNWSTDENYQLLDLITRDIKNYFIFLKGLKLFNLQITPLIDLLNFMINFFCEKNYYEVQSLKSFQDNLWKYEEPNKFDNIFYTKQWIQNASVLILTNALKNAKNHELIVLLRHYDFARIQGSFTSDIKVHDFRKLYRLCHCLSDTNIVLPIRELLSNKIDISLTTANEHYCSIIKTVISSLQQNRYFQEARNFANIAEIESIDITITEWTLRALENLNSIQFWENCWDSLITADTSLVSAFKVLNKFVNQVSSVVVQCLLVFKCLIASQNFENINECLVLETLLWKCVVEIESDLNIKESYSSQWTKIWSDIIVFMKSKKDKKISTASHSVDSTLLNDKISKSLDIVIENLLTNGCIEKAHEVALLFGYNHQDLDIIQACDDMAKGLIKSLSEAPLSVQLKTKAFGQLKKSSFVSDFSDDQREKISFIESISSLASIGAKACQRVLLYFKISCVLSRNYTDIERPELDDLELLKYLIAVSSQNNDALSFAKELISLNKINDEDIASIICRETLIALKSSLSESSPSESSISSSEVMSASFLSLVRLLNDTTILGIKLLNASESEDLLSDPINKALLTELYIKAHECFSLSCDVKGIALVLRKSRLLITQNLLHSQDFNSILRLMTGIGRYSEMTYCFDILKESNQFELLLSKRIEKAPQLRIALLDYLKEDKDMYPLVALRFCLYREIAESHESSARKLLNDIKFLLTTNTIIYREKLETIMFEFIDAHESYCKAGSHSHADSCAKAAQLISLQIHYLSNNLVIINLKDSQIAQFIENNPNFHEALIVADAYQHQSSWTNALFNNVIVNNDSNYLLDFTTRKEISSTLIEELVQKYTQYIASKNWSNEKLTQLKKSMQKIIQYIEDFETRFKIAYKLNLNEMTNKILSEESGAYLQDLRRNGFL